MALMLLHAGCGGLVGRYMDTDISAAQSKLFFPPIGPRPLPGTRRKLRCIRCHQQGVAVVLKPLQA